MAFSSGNARGSLAMPLLTTTIGSYPKPDFLPIPDWFQASSGPDTSNPTKSYLAALAKMGQEAEALFSRGVQQVIDDQLEAGRLSLTQL